MTAKSESLLSSSTNRIHSNIFFVGFELVQCNSKNWHKTSYLPITESGWLGELAQYGPIVEVEFDVRAMLLILCSEDTSREDVNGSSAISRYETALESLFLRKRENEA